MAETCPECKGTREYRGLEAVEPCAACGGKGVLVDGGMTVDGVTLRDGDFVMFKNQTAFPDQVVEFREPEKRKRAGTITMPDQNINMLKETPADDFDRNARPVLSDLSRAVPGFPGCYNTQSIFASPIAIAVNDTMARHPISLDELASVIQVAGLLADFGVNAAEVLRERFVNEWKTEREALQHEFPGHCDDGV